MRVGLLYSAGAVGGVLGAVTVPALRRRIHPARASLGALVVTAPLALGLAAATSFAVAVAAYATWTWACQVTVVNGIAYRLQVVPDELQPHVNVVCRMMAWGGQPVGAAIGGTVAGGASVRTALLLAATIVGVTAVLGFPLLLAARGELDAPAAPAVAEEPATR